MRFRATMSTAVRDVAAPRSRQSVSGLRCSHLPAVVLALVAIAAPASSQAFLIERASVASDGTAANAGSTVSAISADGRFVAFASSASNLVPGDTNSQLDVFVRDRATGAVERVSISTEGLQGTGQSTTPAISADGGAVVFTSAAANLVPGDTNGRFDVFVRDRVAGTTERVSLASDGSQGSLDSVAPAISADGRFVVFASSSANLVAGDTNDFFDVFLRDRLAQTTTRVSVGAAGEGNGFSLAPRISADGSVVVFHSFASNLVAGDTNGVADVFAYEVATGAIERVSVASDGAQGNAQSVAAHASADGRLVAFNSDASTLVPDDTNGRSDVFVHDRASGDTSRVSVAGDGSQGDNGSGFLDPPSLSADGRYVAFTTSASNLVPDDTNAVVDVVLHDRATGATTRVDTAADGTQAGGPVMFWANVSADGRIVAFTSAASNLVPGDTNFVPDVFLWVDTCGDGSLDFGEACDDGNRLDGDCCSAACTAEAEGGVCDDRDLCTRSDTCDGSGRCVGSDPVQCEDGSGQCGSPATCDPETGQCAGGVLPDGSPCDDGDACTVGDGCVAGLCVPGDLEPSACLSAFECRAALSWWKGPWWLSRTSVLVGDLFEEELYRLGTTTSVCSALALPPGQLATEQVCVRLSPADHGHHGGRSVRVRNVLGEQRLDVGEARSLCVPTVPPSEDGGLDAFKCYAAGSAERHFQETKVTVEDEGRMRTVRLRRPELLCNPASVAGSMLVHADAHLVCYRTAEGWWSGRSDSPRPRKIRSALGEDLVTVLAREQLCLPSLVVGD
jgi:cysteine-rich repeat protein